MWPKTELIGSRHAAQRLDAHCEEIELILMTGRSKGLIILNLWVLPLMPNPLDLNTLIKYATKFENTIIDPAVKLSLVSELHESQCTKKYILIYQHIFIVYSDPGVTNLNVYTQILIFL